MKPVKNNRPDLTIDLTSSTARRIGKRIRMIRQARGWSQSQLGEKVGLTFDRIQKYESGVSSPRPELLKKIAKGLGVEPQALIDPDISTPEGCIQALFEMEDKHGLTITGDHDGSISLSFTDAAINAYLHEWQKEREIHGAGAGKGDQSTSDCRSSAMSTDTLDYNLWKWNFPSSISDADRDEKIKRLEAAIGRLRAELKILKSS